MLRLFDPRTGQPEPVTPARQGALRISAGSGPPGAAWLCELLLPDLIRRAAELHRLRVFTAGADDGAGAAFRQAASALNLRPPDTGDPGAPADVTTGGTGRDTAGRGISGRWARSGPVTLPAGLDDAGPDPLAGLTGRGLDPLALRLALLGRRYTEPLTLTWPALEAAGQELLAWRGLVAEWARSPSAQMSAPHRERITAAFDDDLDTPAALQVLRDLAAGPAVPPGARFETFADADRLFGLDLVRDVGRAG